MLEKSIPDVLGMKAVHCEAQSRPVHTSLQPRLNDVGDQRLFVHRQPEVGFLVVPGGGAHTLKVGRRWRKNSEVGQVVADEVLRRAADVWSTSSICETTMSARRSTSRMPRMIVLAIRVFPAPRWQLQHNAARAVAVGLSQLEDGAGLV
jgi:hypothetical protein